MNTLTLLCVISDCTISFITLVLKLMEIRFSSIQTYRSLLTRNFTGLPLPNAALCCVQTTWIALLRQLALQKLWCAKFPRGGIGLVTFYNTGHPEGVKNNENVKFGVLTFLGSEKWHLSDSGTHYYAWWGEGWRKARVVSPTAKS